MDRSCLQCPIQHHRHVGAITHRPRESDEGTRADLLRSVWTDTGELVDPPLLVPFRLAVGDGELSLFTTLTMFGTPRDVTLEELCVELFFPADDATEKALRGA